MYTRSGRAVCPHETETAIMRVIRSWPKDLPANRSYVIDDAERLINSDYDYRGLADFNDDVIQLDWDTAVSREDLVTFAARARQHPDRVLVAPVPIYPETRAGLRQTIWNHRRYETPDRMRYVYTGEPTCHLFGFGMLYLPKALVQGYINECCDRFPFDDSGFAGWHHRRVRAETEITWDVRPIHLHYRISEVPV